MMCIFQCIGDSHGKGAGWPETLPAFSLAYCVL